MDSSYHPHSAVTLANVLEKESESSRWDSHGLVSERYRKILRNIVHQVGNFERNSILGFHAILETESIKIDGQRAFLNVGNNFQDYRRQLGPFVSTVLGDNSDSKELDHFKAILISTDGPRLCLEDLSHHPLFLWPTQRWNFPYVAVPRIENQLGSDWRERYREYMGRRKIGMEETIGKSKYRIFKDLYYDEDKREHPYEGDDLAVVEFSVNVAEYAADQSYRTGEESLQTTEDMERMERELTSMFPTRLTDLFEFMVREGIHMHY